MLTQAQIENLKPGDKVAVTYVPLGKKRLRKSVYLFDGLDRDSVLLMPGTGSSIRFSYRLWDERLSIVEEK